MCVGPAQPARPSPALPQALLPLRFAYLAVLRVFGWLALFIRSGRAKETEFLILSHHAVLQRQVGTPMLSWADRVVLAALAALARQPVPPVAPDHLAANRAARAGDGSLRADAPPVITYAFLEEPGSRAKHAQLRHGPMMCSRYKLIVFMLISDRVRQMSADLGSVAVSLRSGDRISYRYDAITSGQVTPACLGCLPGLWHG
jgi:hypothetical protein